ncbi:polysaccharide deacetylase family protein [Streptomyces sp. PSKA54]|uniref:Polysaccharide deacetylase family protein n=1 Tax=Streptomyces himalayensis subsp. aureolus TaxID=2758039 RepID=A0A7W2D592_9ACTN|nr:polysaccharide deacetylase family protein [Streptomyces himalayensis]MBA4864849.1 polysaccharide deacetylase family protein [Streptomyces himalayensis subsp. aureolus]
MRTKAAVLLLAAGIMSMLVPGCASNPSAKKPGTVTREASAPSAPVSPNPRKGPGESHRTAAFRAWGLEPLPAPPIPPQVKPGKMSLGSVPVIRDVPVKDRVVFLTFDDGAEKDPEFVRMMRDLRIPFTMFLTDAAIRNGYNYFKPLQDLGNAIQNHTLTHPDLLTLSQSAQANEICGQQRRLAEEYGTPPRFFRPPYGNWNEATRAAAQSCGIEAIVLWRETMQIKNLRYQRGDGKLHPGDIILAHFRGAKDLKGTTATEMTLTLLRRIQEQGFTVARLDDYL